MAWLWGLTLQFDGMPQEKLSVTYRPIEALVPYARNARTHSAICVGRTLLKRLPVPDCDVASLGPYEQVAFQREQGGRDTRTPDGQHERQEFVSQGNFIAIHPIVAHQEPASEPLIDMMHGV